METRPLYVVGVGGTLRKHSTSLWALERALQSARAAGATTDLLALRDLDLPMFNPDKSLDEYGPNVQHFIQRARMADAMIWSTAGYHGTLAGVTKNALDFTEFMSGGDTPYLHNKVIGLISTASGELAAVNSINAMVHIVHSLRGTAAPLFVAIPQAKTHFDAHGKVTSERWANRLDQLGRLVVETARKFQSEAKALT